MREQEPLCPSALLSAMPEDARREVAQLRQVEPLKLSALLRGDLDWIAMTALEKDRNRRYQTANGLAIDVQRYLDNELVSARPPSQLYRLQKLVRRHKVVFVSVAVGPDLRAGRSDRPMMDSCRQSDARSHPAAGGRHHRSRCAVAGVQSDDLRRLPRALRPPGIWWYL